MKRIKRLASMLLAMVMVLGMTITTFAAEGDYKLTIATVKGHAYKIYQLATGDISEDGSTLSNIKPGVNTTAESAQEIINALTDWDKTHTHDEDCAEDCQKSTEVVFLQGAALGNAAATIKRGDAIQVVGGTGNDETVTLPGGYYIIEDSFGDGIGGHVHTDECYNIVKDEDGNEVSRELVCNEHVHTDECYKDKDGNTVTDPLCGFNSLSRIMVTLVQDIRMVPKDTTIAPDKKIIDDVDGDGTTEEVDTNEAAIGDTITYKLSGLVPDMQDFYTENEDGTLKSGNFKFVFVDTMSKGLTPSEELQNKFNSGDALLGKVGNTEAKFKVTGLSTDEETGVTTIRIALIEAIQYRHQKGDKVEVTIEAILNQDAVIAPANNPNDLAIDYSNNSNYEYNGEPDFDNNEPKGTTPKVTVTTYTTELKINKVIGNTSDPLKGAEFKLTSTNSAKVGYATGTKYVKETEVTNEDKLANEADWYQLVDGAYTKTVPTDATKNAYKDTEVIYKEVIVAQPTETPTENTEAQAFVDEKGEVKFIGLSVGEYKLEEVTVPDGYNKMDDITFKVTWTKEGGFRVEDVTGMAEGSTITVNGLTSTGDVISGIGNTLATTIPNFSGSLLPSTGGIGTTIFYVVGSILVIGAGILLVAKKRMSSK